MARTKKTTNVDSNSWPKVTQGTHLTVITHEDGRTELKWDDNQLLKEVQEAIASVENKGEENVKVKKTRKSK